MLIARTTHSVISVVQVAPSLWVKSRFSIPAAGLRRSTTLTRTSVTEMWCMLNVVVRHTILVVSRVVIVKCCIWWVDCTRVAVDM